MQCLREGWLHFARSGDVRANFVDDNHPYAPFPANRAKGKAADTTSNLGVLDAKAAPREAKIPSEFTIRGASNSQSAADRAAPALIQARKPRLETKLNRCFVNYPSGIGFKLSLGKPTRPAIKLYRRVALGANQARMASMAASVTAKAAASAASTFMSVVSRILASSAGFNGASLRSRSRASRFLISSRMA